MMLKSLHRRQYIADRIASSMGKNRSDAEADARSTDITGGAQAPTNGRAQIALAVALLLGFVALPVAVLVILLA